MTAGEVEVEEEECGGAQLVRASAKESFLSTKQTGPTEQKFSKRLWVQLGRSVGQGSGESIPKRGPKQTNTTRTEFQPDLRIHVGIFPKGIVSTKIFVADDPDQQVDLTT